MNVAYYGIIRENGLESEKMLPLVGKAVLQDIGYSARDRRYYSMISHHGASNEVIKHSRQNRMLATYKQALGVDQLCFLNSPGAPWVA